MTARRPRARAAASWTSSSTRDPRVAHDLELELRELALDGHHHARRGLSGRVGDDVDLDGCGCRGHGSAERLAGSGRSPRAGRRCRGRRAGAAAGSRAPPRSSAITSTSSKKRSSGGPSSAARGEAGIEVGRRRAPPRSRGPTRSSAATTSRSAASTSRPAIESRRPPAAASLPGEAVGARVAPCARRRDPARAAAASATARLGESARAACRPARPGGAHELDRAPPAGPRAARRRSRRRRPGGSSATSAPCSTSSRCASRDERRDVDRERAARVASRQRPIAARRRPYGSRVPDGRSPSENATVRLSIFSATASTRPGSVSGQRPAGGVRQVLLLDRAATGLGIARRGARTRRRCAPRDRGTRGRARRPGRPSRAVPPPGRPRRRRASATSLARRAVLSAMLPAPATKVIEPSSPASPSMPRCTSRSKVKDASSSRPSSTRSLPARTSVRLAAVRDEREPGAAEREVALVGLHRGRR